MQNAHSFKANNGDQTLIAELKFTGHSTQFRPSWHHMLIILQYASEGKFALGTNLLDGEHPGKTWG